MKKSYAVRGVILLLAFLIMTFAVLKIDVAPIGPENTEVGFATVNGAFQQFIGYHEFWYKVSEVLGYLNFTTAFCFAIVGAVQLFTRKSFFKVDRSIYALAVMYILALALNFFFAKVCVIRYRPVEINGILEPSFPSSHALYTTSVIISAAFEIRRRVKKERLCKTLSRMCCVFYVVVVGTRILAGVHWLTDMVGGMLLGAFLINIYTAIAEPVTPAKHAKRRG